MQTFAGRVLSNPSALFDTEFLQPEKQDLDVFADGVDNIVIPGLCEGDVDTLQQATGLPVRKGPADVRALPEWYGREAVRAELGPRDVLVFAEINDVQSLTSEQVIDRALAYREDGADVIDLGLSLDRSWLTDGPPTIAALREHGLSLSIDTLDPEHICMADAWPSS